MAVGDSFEKVEVRSRREWRGWLSAHAASRDSIWLVTFKKHHADYLAYDDVVEEALCFGWVDSVPRKLDADRTMTLLSPRKPRSVWSGINKARVAAMEQAGLMTDAGRAVVEAAKANGMWTFLDDVERLEVPPDLEAAFARHPGARTRWDGFPPSARRGMLQWIKQGRQAATREKRVEATAREAAAGRRALGG